MHDGFLIVHFAKESCGTDLYRKVQEAKRAQQGEFHQASVLSLSQCSFFRCLERARANELKEKGGSKTTADSRLLKIPDESILARVVAARLDLPVSQRLLTLGFKLSIIKRCWEDQLRLKGKWRHLQLEEHEGRFSFL